MQVSLKEFFDYQPIFEQTQIDDFFEKEVKQKAIEYLWKEAWDKLQKAYDFALKSHGNEKRLSWEPYIVHPVYVTKYLLMIKPWITALQAALLHDVIEDTDVTWDEVLEEFWPDVAFLCLWLEKVSKVRYKWEDRQVETLKKTFLAMGRDIRVIFVKLADRIHNIQTLKYHPKKEKQERIAEETIKIFAPLAKRLWIDVFQTYLENGAFSILHPKEFERIYKYLNKYYSQVNVEKLRKKIEKLLNENDINFISVSWRLKTPYRIYLKFEKYNTHDITEIKDILAFRIILNKISHCYKTLWVVHSEYTPIIKKIKDYISLPKPNGYQSLHTTILWLYKTAVEIQIRTDHMNDFAEYWVAAHFLYKEWLTNNINKKQVDWINKLKEMVDEYQEAWSENHWFFNVLDIDFLRQSVFVYTPKWKIIELPKWSTVLDFAFRIHSDIWFKFKSAIVNWKIVPINYRLINWDIIDIKSFKNKYVVKQSWLDYVISPTSKTKIRSFINKQERDQQIVRGLDFLNKELNEYKLPEINTKNDKISKMYNEKELNSLLVKVFNKNISPSKLIKDIYNISNKKDEEKSLKKEEKVVVNQVIVENSPLYKYYLCPECNPTINNQIIWKVTKDWIKIHTMKCKALNSVNFEKLVESHWKWQERQYYKILFHFNVSWKIENIVPIINIIQGFNIKVLNINTFQDQYKSDYMDIKVSIKLPTTLHLINQKIKKEWKNLFKAYKVSF